MSLVTVQEIQNRVNDQRRDATDGTIDDDKFFRALTAILQIISSRANFKFAVRKTTLQILSGYPTYNIANVLGLTDFKDVKDIRPQNPTDYDGRPFETIEYDEFEQLIGRASTRNVASVEWKDGAPSNLKINRQNDNKPKATIHALDETDTDGTWALDATNGDGINLDSDDLELGGSSLIFDIDVSQSVNNKVVLTVSDMTEKDLTDFLNAGKIRLLAFLPSALATYISSIQLKIGSSATAYYSQTVTVPADGTDFIEGRNEIEFGSPWTATSTPDISAIDYVQITINYAAGMTDTTGVRLRMLEVAYPERLDLNYYSTFLALDNDGTTRKVDVDATNDKILIPHRYMEVVVEGVLWQVMDQMGTDNSDDAEKHRQLFEYGPEYDTSKSSDKRWGGMRLMVRELGVSPVVEKRKFSIKRPGRII